MRFKWLLLLPSLLSIFLASSPAEAARLLRWRFEAARNQLEFTTEGGVQPTAQLIANPTRLVIDLPGTTLGRSTVNQTVGGAVREVRVGQFNPQTARIVVELAPGYTIDPQQVRFRGISPSQWSVQLPTPQRIEASSRPTPSRTENPLPPTNSNPGSGEQPLASGSLSQGFQVTRDGFFIRTSGGEPDNIEVKRSRDRETIDVEVKGIAFAPELLANRDVAVNRYGVSQVQFSQAQNISRIRLNVAKDSPDWQASFSRVGGLVILPRGTTASEIEGSSGQSGNRPVANNQLATIEGIELTNGETQLLIQANRNIRATSTWNRSSNTYEITIPNAQLAEEFRGPQLSANSALSQVRVRQQDGRTVAILVKPAENVQIGELNQLSAQTLSLELRRRRVTRPPVSSIPVPAPENPIVPERPTPSTSLPSIPNSRIVVMIDPGHGGKDPGAVGIGGLQEKNVILPISQRVAALLEQNGVQAVMTRSDDRFISLRGRTEMASRARANLFVSIHANAISMSRPDVNGVETYYYSSGRRLAQTIHRSMLQSTGMRDRGVRQARFFVLRNTSMPAVLVEVGFVTGRDDAPRLSDPRFRDQMAEAIARGILQYIQQNL